jgi:hypothetical protein
MGRTRCTGVDVPPAGVGADPTPDLLAVPLAGGASDDDRTTAAIVEEVLHTVPDATIVVTATGRVVPMTRSMRVRRLGVTVASRGDAAGGFFVDRSTVNPRRRRTSSTRCAPKPARRGAGTTRCADYAVRFGRYC